MLQREVADDGSSVIIYRPNDDSGQWSEAGDADDGDEEGSSSSRVILAVSWQKNRLGVAYFDASTGVLGWGEAYENANFDVLSIVKFQYSPTTIVISSKSDWRLREACKSPLEEHGIPFDVKVIRAHDFTFEAANEKLSMLKRSWEQGSRASFPDDKPRSSRNDDTTFTWQYLSTMKSSESIEMVRAAGGLIAYIQANRMDFGEIDEQNVLKIIVTVKGIAFDGLMYVDMNTLQSLQVFKVGKQPRKATKPGALKEGLSLYSVLADKIRSRNGKYLLKEWLLKPVTDLAVINSRLDAVESLMEIGNSDILRAVRGNIGSVKNLRAIIARIKQAKASVVDWHNLYKSLYAFRAIADATSELRCLGIFARISNSFNQNLLSVLSMLGRVIDFTESKAANRIVIALGVDKELDEYKRTYEGLDDFLTMVAQREMSQLPPHFPYKVSVVYYPQLGYLIVIPRTPENEQNPDMLFPGLQFHFMSTDCIYYKNDGMRELDTEIGDIHGIIVDKEAEILRKLETYVLKFEDAISGLVEAAAELDCLQAFAMFSRENNYCRPNVTADNVLDIVEGRHPLQEILLSSSNSHSNSRFIPNDTFVGDDTHRLHLITGPNCSGKSVYIKQVGLITFLAHIGCYVPAEFAKIGITDRLLTRIQTRESASVSQSAFAIDIGQMANILQVCSPRSLLLIDEFGKGTNSLEGLALLASCCNYLLNHNKGPNHHSGASGPTTSAVTPRDVCPKTFISTHFTEILEYNLVDLNNAELAFNSMDVMVVDNKKDSSSATSSADTDDLVFLYKLVPGRVMPSYGLVCASMAGVPLEICARASEVSERLRNGDPVEPLETERSAKRRAKYEKVVEKFRQFDCDTGNAKDFINMIAQLAEEAEYGEH